ncbi:MAG: TerD family protein, partial [Oscillospiraceae bacterium]
SVIEITAAGAALENLRVELTEAAENDTAIVTQCPVAVKNVEVLGGVKGFGAEDGYFDVPKTIALGEFAAEQENTFTLTVNVPVETEISCDTMGVGFSPKRLPAGRSELTVTVRGISAQTFLYAQVLFTGQFTRRIYLTGRPKNDIPTVSGMCVYTAPERGASEVIPAAPEVRQAVPESLTAAQPTVIPAVTDVIAVNTPAPLIDKPLLELLRGQRINLGQYIGSQCEIRFSCTKPAGMDIDPYAFLLDSHERSFGDRGLVFFGNETSEKGELHYFPTDGHMELDLTKIDYRVQRIALAYSIYAGGAGKSFGQVRNPRVSLFAQGKERVTFTMDGLTDETTVVALEFYLYKGEWKLSAVGAGYRDGMARLCNHYGIEVEE